ncbi:hypothetical protein ACVZS3_26645, partial [Klebsiella pneumoniae]|uniref:hypothetical protein n=2 Tax=Klebsiella pneumoniae TaxID=573 RepID=UPI0012FF1D08
AAIQNANSPVYLITRTAHHELAVNQVIFGANTFYFHGHVGFAQGECVVELRQFALKVHDAYDAAARQFNLDAVFESKREMIMILQSTDSYGINGFIISPICSISLAIASGN